MTMRVYLSPASQWKRCAPCCLATPHCASELDEIPKSRNPYSQCYLSVSGFLLFLLFPLPPVNLTQICPLQRSYLAEFSLQLVVRRCVIRYSKLRRDKNPRKNDRWTLFKKMYRCLKRDTIS